MGQYHKVVNLDKPEYLNPHDFGDGLKLMEFGNSAYGTLSALAGLLALDVQQEGPWAGCRITITGDYGDEGRFLPPELAQYNLYTVVSGHLEDEEEDGDGEKPSRPEVPKYEALKDQCIRQLAGLGISMEFARFGEGDVEALAPSERVFEQPEDLFEALGVFTQEDLRQTLSDCMTVIRCSRLASKLTWATVKDVTLRLNEEGWVKSLDIQVSNERGIEEFPREFTRTLHFPATVSSVREFFMAEEKKPRLTAS